MTRRSHAQMAEDIGKLAWSKRTWLQSFAGVRPAHEVETRQRELEVLEQAEADYRRAAERVAQ